MPCVYTRHWFVNCPLCAFPERPHSLPLVSVRLPRLKVNMATVLAVSPLALWTFGLWGGPASDRHAHPSAQVEWLQSEPFCGHVLLACSWLLGEIYSLGNGLEYDRWPVSIVKLWSGAFWTIYSTCIQAWPHPCQVTTKLWSWRGQRGWGGGGGGGTMQSLSALQ